MVPPVACQWTRGDGAIRCDVCGRQLAWPESRQLPVRNCQVALVPGIGDRVEKWLAAVGITEARWLAIKGVVIEKPTCGCAKRKETLNRWGRWLAAIRGGA